jgi:hypothetical protein
MQREYLIELGDAVVAVKQPNGRVKLNQLYHPAAAGAAGGALWGTLIGMLFLMPLAGTALGAAAGALRRRHDRCRYRAPVHEGRGADSAIGQCRSLSADPRDDCG